jgi:hypothetical protein
MDEKFNNIDFLHKVPLVALCKKYPKGTTPKNFIYITVSPKPSVMVRVKRLVNIGNSIKTKVKVMHLKYGNCTQEEQYGYIQKYMTSVYNDKGMSMYASFELNEKGQLHAHGFIEHETDVNNYQLLELRQYVKSHMDTLGHLVYGKTDEMSDYCNNIVLPNKSLPEWIDYMLKDIQYTKDKYPIMKF